MKKIFIWIIIVVIPLFISCGTLPKETITISETIGKDLQVLHESHKSTLKLYYNKIEVEINSFIDNVYAPYVIHYVLNSELNKYKNGEPSLYKTIEEAGISSQKENTDAALNDMVEFTEDAYNQINLRREELLTPIRQQKDSILSKVDASYQSIIYANTRLTMYLESVRKVKDTRNEAYSIVGLDGLEDEVTEKIIELSNFLDNAIKVGNKIDVKSEEAKEKIENLINQIKEQTNKINHGQI